METVECVCLGEGCSGVSSQAALQTSSSSPFLSFTPSPLRTAPCPVSYCVVTVATRPETVRGAPAWLQPSFIIIIATSSKQPEEERRRRRQQAASAGAAPLCWRAICWRVPELTLDLIHLVWKYDKSSKILWLPKLVRDAQKVHSSNTFYFYLSEYCSKLEMRRI